MTAGRRVDCWEAEKGTQRWRARAEYILDRLSALEEDEVDVDELAAYAALASVCLHMAEHWERAAPGKGPSCALAWSETFRSESDPNPTVGARP